MELGGHAAKVGDRYENLWVVQQLLLVLADEVRTVEWEPAGEEGEGVDVRVTLPPDGRIEHQQCKHSTTRSASWRMSDLAGRGIFKYLRDRLEANPKVRYVFVSAQPTKAWDDLIRSALHSRDSDSFLAQANTSQQRLKALEVFCEGCGLALESESDLAVARELLRRSEVRPFHDGETSRREVRALARRYVVGEPANVLRELESWVRDRLREATAYDDIDAFLASAGYELRDLSRDPRVPKKIAKLRKRFQQHFAPLLVGGELIPRSATEEVLDVLDKARVVLVHGDAGSGKSGVLHELSMELEQRSQPFLPVRLDRQLDLGTDADSFGKTLELPASPAHCLHAVIKEGQRGVLILDQLDALRWSSAHSSQALDVVGEVIQQALDLPRGSRATRDVRVVVACRSFDIEHDPQLLAWKNSQRSLQTVEVGNLSKEQVQEAVKRTPFPYYDLSVREQDLLQNIFHLSLWLKLVDESEELPRFSTHAGLLRMFWATRYDALAKLGMDQERARGLLHDLADHMDRKSKVSAPTRVLEASEQEAQALQSLDILTVTGRRVTFLHQSHRDYLVAERLMKELDREKRTVLEWLGGPERQGLFRREQLRLILAVLRDDQPGECLQVVQDLLESDSVRFHLKQVALQELGRVDEPSRAEVDLVIQLLQVEEWRDHVLEETIYGSVVWFEALDDRGLVADWLECEVEEHLQAVVSLLRRVVEKCGDRVARLFQGIDETMEESLQETAAQVVLNARVEHDSSDLFELRLKLIALDWRAFHWTQWDGLARQDFARFSRLLFEVLLQFARRAQSDKDVRFRLKDELAHGFEKLDVSKAELAELVTWWPLLARAVQALMVLPYIRAADVEALLGTLRAIGVELLRRDWEFFVAVLLKKNGECSTLDTTAIDALSEAPLEAGLADVALIWLLENPERLRAKYDETDNTYRLSGDALGQLSQVCSQEIFELLERFLLIYQEPDLKQCFKRRRGYLEKGSKENGGRWWFLEYPSISVAGITPHRLLSKLPADRLSETAQAYKRQLRRKFGPAAKYENTVTVTAGFVGSPLDTETARRLSDNAWLQIINSEKLDSSQRPRPWVKKPGRLAESSPETFSGDLRLATHREPERFGRLALKLAPDADSHYVAAILQGLAETSPPNDLGVEAKEEWCPAQLETMEKVLRLPQVQCDDNARRFTRILTNHAELSWSPEVLAELVRIAVKHPDPTPDRSVDDLESVALNCARGSAGHTIRSILLKQTERFGELKPALESLINDPHVAVRTAAIDAWWTVLGIEPGLAVRRFLDAVQAEEELLETRAADRFLKYSVLQHIDELHPLLTGMVQTDRDAVVSLGAECIAACWMMEERLEEEFKACLSGTSTQRFGVARAAAGIVKGKNEQYQDRARKTLVRLLDDESEEVRQVIGEMFRRVDLEQFEPDEPLLVGFPRSRSFETAPFQFISKLKDYPGKLLPLASSILDAGRSFAGGHLAEQVRDPQSQVGWNVRHLVPLLLRLYEQSADGQHEEIHQQCLDVWDQLLKARVPQAGRLTQEIDRDSWHRDRSRSE